MNLSAFSLEGKVAIVTGCANGIGAGIACGLAEAGADIFGVYNSSAPDTTVEQVRACEQRFVGFQADIGAEDFDPQVIVNACLESYGKFDILVNNAGVCPRGHLLEHPREFWDAAIRTNETGLFLLSQAAAKQFVAKGIRGKIINIASMLSYHGGMNVPGYAASKHAVAGLTKSMASDLGKYHINVNAMAPGWIKTKMSAAVRNNPEREPGITSRIPLGEWGNPSDFKGPAVFLASAASDYLTGVIIPVDGGYLVR